MPEPRFKKNPTEIFGYPYTDLSETAQTARNNQYCPFIKSECTKPRKSEPHIKMGGCSVGYKVNFEKVTGYIPVIICPKRFDIEAIKKEVTTHNFKELLEDEEVQWCTEVSLGKKTGVVDYVAARIRNKKIIDFVGIEPQAAGTTNSYWQAMVDFKENKEFLSENYDYGINWANEFAKTMMQQTYKKGIIFESWRKKVIFVVQDVGLAYLRDAYDMSGLKEADDKDFIHFYSLKMVWNEKLEKWEQRLQERLSTDSIGIVKILGGIAKEKYPTEETFTKTVLSRLNKR